MVTTRSHRIPLTSLSALTLHSNRKTTSRRTSPIPQLTCQGRPCRQYQPDVVQCVKMGQDGAGGLEWNCEADLPQGVRFGEVEVGCEGWDGPGDPYILRGSCGLTYNLVRSSSAFETDGPFSFSNPAGNLPSSLSSYLNSPSAILSSGYNLFFLLLTLYLLTSFLHKLFRPFLSRFFPPGPPGPPQPPGSRGRGNGGPGGGGGDSAPPPPPYTPHPPLPPPKLPPAEGTTGWRPGFWTGLAAGWAGNALMGSAAPATPRRDGRDPYAAFQGDRGGGFWGGGGGLGGGGGEGGGRFGQRGGGGRGWGIREMEDDGYRDRGVGGSGSWFGRGAASGGTGGMGGGGTRRSTGFGGTNVR
ncbi:hypothetical protein JCM11641_003880 [Rhodosporidiobolus odoratus]